MRTARIKVDLSSNGLDRSYEILIRDGILDEIPNRIQPLKETSSIFVVTDSNVAKLYGEKVRVALLDSGRKVDVISFPAGEASKNIDTAWLVASKLNRFGADRNSLILALGGGVVGDLAGFVASVYKRGIAYIQLPTTLLAQVDSSIGGKTGVDTPWGKNQLGTFYQPKGVLTDPLALVTLPREERLNGLAEIVKCAVIANRKMFDRLSRLTSFDSEIPVDIIIDTCEIKASVVSEDEKENNLRTILNYGHTVGHAIESSSNYRLSHGLCLVLGMMAESWIALHLGIIQKDGFERQNKLLRRLIREFRIRPPILDKRTLLKFALADKKTVSTSLSMSLPAGLGTMHKTKEGSYKVSVPKETFMRSVDCVGEILLSN